eukprot:GHVU01152246.1.p2 GENE.GHVU01152246.1~~GHVU01152246.1.p2  ORF type:complete len:122 (+),score=18.66 GHVU01152246.1:106-471(+)
MDAINNSSSSLYEIEHILAIHVPARKHNDAAMLVHWRGFEVDDDSWLFCRQLARDVPNMFVDALVRFRTQLPHGFTTPVRTWLKTQAQKAYLDAAFDNMHPAPPPSRPLPPAPSAPLGALD